jgi:hypothetical protein
MSLDASVSVYMSASFRLISWNEAMGLPNWTRSLAYLKARRTPLAMPRAKVERKRPFHVEAAHHDGDPPVLDSQDVFTGMRQSSSSSSPVREPRLPTFEGPWTRESGRVVSRMKAVIPFGPAAVVVLVYRMMVRASGPLVMKVLRPLTT